jgi:hypothetical protein
LSRRVLSHAGLQYLAERDMLDIARVNTGSLQRSD